MERVRRQFFARGRLAILSLLAGAVFGLAPNVLGDDDDCGPGGLGLNCTEWTCDAACGGGTVVCTGLKKDCCCRDATVSPPVIRCKCYTPTTCPANNSDACP